VRTRRIFKSRLHQCGMLDRLMKYGDRDKGPDTALITMLFLLATLAFISQSGALSEAQTQEQVTGSVLVSDETLGLFRFACASLSLFTLCWISLDPKGANDPFISKTGKLVLGTLSARPGLLPTRCGTSPYSGPSLLSLRRLLGSASRGMSSLDGC